MNNTKKLVKRAQSNDLAAFEELIKLYQNRVFSLSLHLTSGNYADAQDVAQEALIRAYKALDSFRQEADFGTWIHRITVNVWLNFCRKNRTQSVLSLDAPLQGQDGNEFSFELIAEDGDPIQAVEEKEFQSLVEMALNYQTPEHRAVLILREMEGYSYDEMAQILDCSLGTVKSRLNRARRSLKQTMIEMAQQHSMALPAAGKE